MGPLLQQLAEGQQVHDGPGGAVVAAEHGDAHGDGVQQLHLQLPPQEAAQAAQQVGYAADDGDGGAERGGEEEAAEEPGRRHVHKTLLVLPVDGPAGVGRGRHGLGGAVPVEAREACEQGGAAALVGENGAAGALMHQRVQDAVLLGQPGLQQVRLVQRHPGLDQLDADAAPGLG